MKLRYPPDQKAKAQTAILEAGAKALRKNGFYGIGVDGLAAAAGVTSGAFYSNFSSKEAILEKVIERCLGEPFIDTDNGTLSERRKKLKEWLAIYISENHREHPEEGCVMPTLSADVARASPSVRGMYSIRINVLHARIVKVIGGSAADRDRRAWSIIALMVGAVTIARAMPEGADASGAMEAALETAISLVA